MAHGIYVRTAGCFSHTCGARAAIGSRMTETLKLVPNSPNQSTLTL